MSYILSTEELKQKFGDISLEIISHRENVRITCVRRLSDNAAVAYNIAAFQNEGIRAFGKDLHGQILSGKAIGETIKNSGIPHERAVSEFFSSKVNFGLAFLFDTKKDTCLSRTVNYKIEGSPYVSIAEFYNPEYRSVERDQKEGGSQEECFVIDQLRPGFEEGYLRLAHGFLKKPMHVGIENPDIFVNETRETLELLMKDVNTKLFVAANDAQFIGYIALNIHPALHVNGLECVVRELYVRDEYQGKGVGAVIVAYAERYAKKRGCKRMSLATKWDDEKQKDFYESLGFSRRCDFAIKKISD